MYCGQIGTIQVRWINVGQNFQIFGKCTIEGWTRACWRTSPYTWGANAYSRVKSYQNRFCPLLGFWIPSIACFGNVTLLPCTKWLHKYSTKENITSSFWIGTNSNTNTSANANANTEWKIRLHLLLQGCSLLSPVEHFPELVARLAFVQECHYRDKKVQKYFWRRFEFGNQQIFWMGF